MLQKAPSSKSDKHLSELGLFLSKLLYFGVLLATRFNDRQADLYVLPGDCLEVRKRQDQGGTLPYRTLDNDLPAVGCHNLLDNV